MIQFIKNIFDKEPIIRFSPYSGAPDCSEITNIKLAKDVKPKWLESQKVFKPEEKFVNCPGMDDLYKSGYIIPAWTDIKIKANKAGTIVKLHNEYPLPPQPMSPKLVQGIIEIDKNVKFAPMKINSPWGIFTKSGYSAFVLPATYHSPFLKDLFIYSGIVDYDNFSTINMIFCALRECEIEIPAGTPLLQIIPYKREVITGEVTNPNQRDINRHMFEFPTRVKSAYRKFFHKKKIYKLINKSI